VILYNALLHEVLLSFIDGTVQDHHLSNARMSRGAEKRAEKDKRAEKRTEKRARKTEKKSREGAAEQTAEKRIVWAQRDESK
jgi:hypothetical protein